MSDILYAFRIDESTGRAYVTFSGEITPEKVGNTFLAIAMNRSWENGDRSIVYQFSKAHFPMSLTYSDILKKAQSVKDFTRPGKSAIVVHESSPIQKQVSSFYMSVAAVVTERKIKLFSTLEDAEAWLDAEGERLDRR